MPDIELVASETHGGGQAKLTAKARSKVLVKQDDVSSDDDDAEEAAAAEVVEEAVPLARRPRPRRAPHVVPAVSAKAAPPSKKPAPAPAPERRRTRVS